jgi:hypothetical protein
MKKCEGCNREIDKYAIACQYCGILLEKDEKAAAENKLEPNVSSEIIAEDVEKEHGKDK